MVPNDFDILVYCITFNQSKYINDCINGIVSQKTKIPFLVCIIDDASTDGEQNLLTKYVDDSCDRVENQFIKNGETENAFVHFGQHRDNKNCFLWILNLKKNLFRFRKLKWSCVEPYMHGCKYHAWCEGDDYWTDSNKLQRQYDFMECHPEYSCCFHAVSLLFPDGHTEKEHRYSNDKYDCPIEDAIHYGGPYMATNSMFYVSKYYMENQPKWMLEAPVGDGPMTLMLMHRGKVAYMDKVMSVYRVSATNSWTQRMRSHRKAWQHHCSIQKMWKGFDQWSDYQYHTAVKARLRTRAKAYYNSLLYDLKCKLFPNISFHKILGRR